MTPFPEGSGHSCGGNGVMFAPALFLPTVLPLIFFLLPPLLALPLVSVPPSQNTKRC